VSNDKSPGSGPAGPGAAEPIPAEPGLTESVLDGPVQTWPASDIAGAWQRELPGARTGSIEVITPLWRVAKVLADERRRTLHRLGVDSSTLDLLSVIRRSGPPYELTTKEITRRTLVTAGAISQRITRAEQAGLVERSPSAASRRAVAVRLTAAGHRLIEPVVRRLLEHEAELIGVLTPAEHGALAAILAKLEHALTAAPAPAPPDPADG
jgi:DNA-binding MarR family transcriptional regulator